MNLGRGVICYGLSLLLLPIVFAAPRHDPLTPAEID